MEDRHILRYLKKMKEGEYPSELAGAADILIRHIEEEMHFKEIVWKNISSNIRKTIYPFQRENLGFKIELSENTEGFAIHLRLVLREMKFCSRHFFMVVPLDEPNQYGLKIMDKPKIVREEDIAKELQAILKSEDMKKTMSDMRLHL